MQWIESTFNWVKANDSLVWWTLAGGLSLFIVAPIIVAGVLIGLPSDYFSTERRPLASLSRLPSLRIALLVGKNLLGIALLIAGIAMLLMPGQGLLTILVGLALVDFPGKVRLQHCLVSRPSVSRTINWLRRRAGREPLKKLAGTGARA